MAITFRVEALNFNTDILWVKNNISSTLCGFGWFILRSPDAAIFKLCDQHIYQIKKYIYHHHHSTIKDKLIKNMDIHFLTFMFV